MNDLTAERIPKERIQIIPRGNPISDRTVNNDYYYPGRNACAGECFVVRGRKKKLPNWSQNVGESESGTNDRFSPAWNILGKLVSGFIFIAILTWAIPISFARVAEARNEAFQKDHGFPMVQEYAGSNASGWYYAGRDNRGSTNPVLDSMAPGRQQVSAAPNEYGVTRNGYIRLPASIAREIDLEKFDRQMRNQPLYSDNGEQGEMTSTEKEAADAADTGIGIRVTGIICSANGICTAVIDNEVYKEGDMIGGSAYVGEINHRRVTLHDADNPGVKYQIGI